MASIFVGVDRRRLRSDPSKEWGWIVGVSSFKETGVVFGILGWQFERVIGCLWFRL